jgi:hypothetical protein
MKPEIRRGGWRESDDALEVGPSIYQLADGSEAILAHEIVPRVTSSPELLQRGAHFPVIGRFCVFVGGRRRFSRRLRLL